MDDTRRLTASLQDRMISWRHDLHAHPELGGREERTAARVAGLLEEFGLEVHRGVGGGVVGVLRRGGSAASVALRADMDALAIQEENRFAHCSSHPGCMHACGHDGHMAMLLGAACHLAERGSFDGTAYFIFQPAEEPGFGAKAMLAEGLFERFPADAVYGMHNMPSLPLGSLAVRPGPVMACEDHFEIVISGKGTHAALPHLGVDPIVIGAQIVTALQTIVARRLNPVENAVVSVTEFLSDGATNVLPTTVTLRGDTRSFLPAVQELIESSMGRMAEHICAAHGAACTFRYSREFSSTINTPAETAAALDAARQTVGEAGLILDCPPFMTSEDFGEMLRARPGAYLFLGSGAGEGGVGLHNPCFDFPDTILTIGADFWVHLVESRLSAAGASPA